MTQKPVIVALRTGRAMLLGGLAGFCTLVWFSVGLAIVSTGKMDGQAIFITLGIGLVLAGYAAFYLGVAIRKPVALKMDSKGISGYFAEPAIWPEIMEINTFEGSKGARYLGFAFLNPDIIRARQSAWRKFVNWSRNPTDRYQITISQDLLQDASIESLATIARHFHREA